MLKNYFKIAIKVLLRRKFFTFISLFGISFTLVVLIVLSAMYENIISLSPPESNADRCLYLNRLRLTHTDSPNRGWSSSPGYRTLDTHARNLPGVEKMSIHANAQEVVAFRDGVKLELSLKRTDGVFWEILDFEFLEGGPLTSQHETQGNMVAVINQSTRARYFGSGPALNQPITLDGQRFVVIGVVEDVPEYREHAFGDVWVPNSTAKSNTFRQQIMGGFKAILLARSKADFPSIKAAYRRQLNSFDFPDPKRFNLALSPADTKLEAMVRGFSRSWEQDPGLGLFLGKVSLALFLFMLLPAVNLININMSRILERASEIGVRKAFGGTSRALTFQFLVENLLLTLFGGLIGFLIAHWVLGAISQTGLIPYAQFSINPMVLAYGLGFTLFFGVFSGVYPAWRMSKLHPVIALKGGDR